MWQTHPWRAENTLFFQIFSKAMWYFVVQQQEPTSRNLSHQHTGRFPNWWNRRAGSCLDLSLCLLSLVWPSPSSVSTSDAARESNRWDAQSLPGVASLLYTSDHNFQKWDSSEAEVYSSHLSSVGTTGNIPLVFSAGVGDVFVSSAARRGNLRLVWHLQALQMYHPWAVQPVWSWLSSPWCVSNKYFVFAKTAWWYFWGISGVCHPKMSFAERADWPAHDPPLQVPHQCQHGQDPGSPPWGSNFQVDMCVYDN